ncbi:phosphonopyruvate decarboxylase [Erwinia persicina]|uniref:phosphonopyruvate decarboxylase n=1 Tax=Erwinia persicina TaxID=55211 RepID=UPI00210E1EC7|nr:phosphonopyruvate decarboxylase [Erwinia persicina]MCQ4094960.1 phosphonopyruvate decarboxylase [Erwinia persicina]MCQ4100075.1 phosphonopyruvate decarboxylase [Erwinia persicina]
MLSEHLFTQLLKTNGFSFASGVPCSYLTSVITALEADPELEYVSATSEGEALALTSGAWLAGRQGVVLCQNSGLGNMINPLTSLNAPFQIPVLLVITLRGLPGAKDEPQHEVMGRVTADFLATMDIPCMTLSSDPEEMTAMVSRARSMMDTLAKPVALLVEKHTFREAQADGYGRADVPRRADVLEHLLAVAEEEDILIATTGKTGRELFTLKDRKASLYCVGSMGYASSLALGIAMSAPNRTVCVLDGDGALLMHAGNLATAGQSGCTNLIHIVLNNACYDSTGGQSCASAGVDFVQLAKSMGYRHAELCKDIPALLQAYQRHREGGSGPALLAIPLSSGSLSPLGRPTLAPREIARRLQKTLNESLDRQ